MQVGSPVALPHPCPHHLHDCGLPLGPGSLVKNARAPCSALSELRPRSPEVVGMEHHLGQQGRFIFLLICLFSCRQRGHLPGPQQPPLCSSFSVAAVCLTHLLVASLALAGSRRPPALCLCLSLWLTALGVGAEEIRTSTITPDSWVWTGS